MGSARAYAVAVVLATEALLVALLFLGVTFEDIRDVPKEIDHRVRTSFDLPSGALFPERTTDTGARTGVSRKPPVVIGPPLKGKNWVVSNGCCTTAAAQRLLHGLHPSRRRARHGPEAPGPEANA